jgi:hypothetical protein
VRKLSKALAAPGYLNGLSVAETG